MMIISTSSRLTPAISRAFSQLAAAWLTMLSPLPRTWRFRMPVRCAIHSSFVSTIFERSSLEIACSGTELPTPSKAQPVWACACTLRATPLSSDPEWRQR